MKKLIPLLWVLLLLFAGCQEASVLEDDPSTPLVTVEGETIFTVQDLSYLMIEQEVSHEVKGTSLKTEKEVFEEAAEQRILAYIAEKLGAAEDRSFWEEEFDSHMEEIQDTDIYAEEKELSDTLQERLGMDDEAYKDWTVEKNVDAASAENLIDEITNDYQTILDPVELEENTRKNLEALAEMYDARIQYPGLSEEKRTVLHVL